MPNSSKYPLNWSVLPLFLIGILSIYICQLAAAGSIADGAAAQTANSLSPLTYLFLAPWLHSDHMHLLQNAAIFSILGYWFQEVVGKKRFLAFVLLTGYLSLFLPVYLGFGGLSIGISGVTKALLAFFVLYHFTLFMKTANETDSSIQKAGLYFILFFLPFVFLLVTPARFIGHVSAPDGTAVGAHLIGLVLGGLWFCYRAYGNRDLFNDGLDHQ